MRTPQIVPLAQGVPSPICTEQVDPSASHEARVAAVADAMQPRGNRLEPRAPAVKPKRKARKVAPAEPLEIQPIDRVLDFTRSAPAVLLKGAQKPSWRGGESGVMRLYSTRPRVFRRS